MDRGVVFPEVSHGAHLSSSVWMCTRLHRGRACTGGESAPPVFVGEIGTRQADLEKLIHRLQRRRLQAVVGRPIKMLA